MVSLRYADLTLANSPITPIQSDIYALILGTFHWQSGSRGLECA